MLQLLFFFMEIANQLFILQDKQYAGFQARLLPTLNRESIIGVRTPELRKLAKQLHKSANSDAFLRELPHRYFDENQLHAFLISEIKDYYDCLIAVKAFLPYIDNWATCDQLSPKVFAKHKDELITEIKLWFCSSLEYTIRFAIKMLMQHYLDADFQPQYNDLVAGVKRDEYYVRMMQAWYFATALAKQYDATIPYLETQHLDAWTHNKTIQKAIESYRLTDKQKDYLRTLKVK